MIRIFGVADSRMSSYFLKWVFIILHWGPFIKYVDKQGGGGVDQKSVVLAVLHKLM